MFPCSTKKISKLRIQINISTVIRYVSKAKNLTIEIWSSSMLSWDSAFGFAERLALSAAASWDMRRGSGFTVLVATSVISLTSSDLSPEFEPADDLRMRFLLYDGDWGDELGEQDSARSPRVSLGHLLNEAGCISASPLIFKLSAVWNQD